MTDDCVSLSSWQSSQFWRIAFWLPPILLLKLLFWSCCFKVVVVVLKLLMFWSCCCFEAVVFRVMRISFSENGPQNSLKSKQLLQKTNSLKDCPCSDHKGTIRRVWRTIPAVGSSENWATSWIPLACWFLYPLGPKKVPCIDFGPLRKKKGVNLAKKPTSHRITWDFEKWKSEKFACSDLAVKNWETKTNEGKRCYTKTLI